MKTSRPLGFALLAVTAPIPLVARAEIYMTAEHAAFSLLPGVALQETKIELSPAEVERIESESGETVREKTVDLWRGPRGEAVVIDRVLGKHEFITYAVALGADGAVRGIEILEYKETYGSEIRRPEWRAQFTGKGPTSPLKLEKDIHNISGATLSCSHITAGVRRVVRTYEVIRSRST